MSMKRKVKIWIKKCNNMRESTVPFVEKLVKYYEELIKNETNLDRIQVLYDNKKELEKLLLKFWMDKIEKGE